MSCVFIFSNTFFAKTIIHNINYSLNINVSEIVLLKENHRETDYEYKKTKYNNVKISVLSSLCECVSKCDFVIVSQNSSMPQRSISTIMFEAQRTNKKCYVLKDSWADSFDSINTEFYKDNFKPILGNYPVIVHISLGNMTQPYCAEIELNKIMKESGINIGQFFSASTFDLLTQFEDNHLLNQSLSSNIGLKVQAFDIVIYSINIGASINNIFDYIEVFKQLKADYVLLQVERNFCDYENAANAIKYCCFSKMDKIIKSHYTRADGKYALYCNDILDVSENIYDIESQEWGNLLFRSIITKLSLPTGIRRL